MLIESNVLYNNRNLAAASGLIGTPYRTIPSYLTPISSENGSLNLNLETRQPPTQVYYNTNNESLFYMPSSNIHKT